MAMAIEAVARRDMSSIRLGSDAPQASTGDQEQKEAERRRVAMYGTSGIYEQISSLTVDMIVRKMTVVVRTRLDVHKDRDWFSGTVKNLPPRIVVGG